METDEKGRFVKGGPGGPGKPKGSLSLLTLLKGILKEVPEGERASYAEQLMRLYIVGALAKNDGTAIRDLVDRIDGKAMQKIVVENTKDAEWLEVFKDIKDEAGKEAERDPDSGRAAEAEDTDS